MPANGHTKKIKTSLDTEVCDKVIEMERDFFRYVDTALPKKHKYSLVNACTFGLMSARRLIVKGMDYDVRLYPEQKHAILSDARAELRNIAVDMQHLNDLGDMSNAAKAHFDEQMNETQTQLAKLLNSLSTRIGKRAGAVEVRQHGTLDD